MDEVVCGEHVQMDTCTRTLSLSDRLSHTHTYTHAALLICGDVGVERLPCYRDETQQQEDIIIKVSSKAGFKPDLHTYTHKHTHSLSCKLSFSNLLYSHLFPIHLLLTYHSLFLFLSCMLSASLSPLLIPGDAGIHRHILIDTTAKTLAAIGPNPPIRAPTLTTLYNYNC